MSAADRHSRRAEPALRKLAELDPAFAALALWCRHRDRDAAPALGAAAASPPPPAWSDARGVSYGPRFEEFDLHERIGLAAHHILHVAFRHAPRARALEQRLGAAFDPALFGLAADAIVNETLILAGRVMPRPCVLLTELLAEALEETTPPEQALAAYDVERLYQRLADAAPARAGDGDGEGRGSGRGEGKGDGNAPADRARAYGEKRGFAPDLSAAEAESGAAPEAPGAEDAEWRERVARALAAGRAVGDGLGAIGWRLADLPESHTPWETILRGMLMKAALKGPRPSHRRPTRRWLALEDGARRRGGLRPVYEPARALALDTARIAIGLDASASVGEGLLRRFAAEVAGVARRSGAETHLFVFDVAVREHRRLEARSVERDLGSVDFTRGGGTAFGPVIEAARRVDPSAILLLTDLDGPIGPRPGRLPVIWAVPAARAWIQPPFGVVLSLDR